ncbi:hypothetical protein [Parapedobacter sp. 2B3]|uniref:hypothetical protein n=1 Tax=Parapedobacter sp. 2B3 TaxID=3342381 RepID=UPI0035B611E9
MRTNGDVQCTPGRYGAPHCIGVAVVQQEPVGKERSDLFLRHSTITVFPQKVHFQAVVLAVAESFGSFSVLDWSRPILPMLLFGAKA